MGDVVPMNDGSKAWKLGFLASLDFSSWNAEDVVEALSRIGYEGIEWTSAHFNPRTRTTAELAALVKTTRDRGLEVSEVGAQQDLVTPDERVRGDRLTAIRECIKAVSQVGIRTMNLFTGPAPWDPTAPRIPDDMAEGKAWSLVLESFNELVADAEKYDVDLAVEAVFGHLCHDYYTMKELLDDVDSRRLCVNMDPSHYALYRNDVPWVVRKLGDKIRHVHMKDVAGSPGRHGEDFIFPLLGEGMIDWNGFLEALEDIGYRGFLSVEFESFGYYAKVLGKDPVKAAEISMEAMKQLVTHRRI